MKRIIANAALCMFIALAVSAPASLAAQRKSKATPEHAAAIKKCNEEYQAAVKDAKTKKGKERKDALAAAKKTKADCIKSAPK